MKKFVLTICVVIICMVTALFYGKTGIKTTTGVHDPDIALSENTAMEIFYTGGQKTSYFNNESNYSLDDMEKDSSFFPCMVSMYFHLLEIFAKNHHFSFPVQKDFHSFQQMFPNTKCHIPYI